MENEPRGVEIASEAIPGLMQIAFWGLFFGGPIFAALMLPFRPSGLDKERPK